MGNTIPATPVKYGGAVELNIPPGSYSSTSYPAAWSGVWVAESYNQYTCPQTITQGYCVVPKSQAENVCNADPKCLGFVQNAYGIAHGNTAQLTRMKIVPNSTANGIFYMKP